MRRIVRPCSLEVEDDLPEGTARRRVQARRGLVEEDQLGIVHEGEGDRETLPLAARQLPGLALALLPEIEPIDQLCRRVAVTAVERPEEVQDLGDGQLRVERRCLEGHPDSRLQGLRVPVGIHAENRGLAGIGGPQSLEDLDRRRLARSVRAEEAEDLARPDLERDPVDRTGLAVLLAQVS